MTNEERLKALYQTARETLKKRISIQPGLSHSVIVIVFSSRTLTQLVQDHAPTSNFSLGHKFLIDIKPPSGATFYTKSFGPYTSYELLSITEQQQPSLSFPVILDNNLPKGLAHIRVWDTASGIVKEI